MRANACLQAYKMSLKISPDYSVFRARHTVSQGPKTPEKFRPFREILDAIFGIAIRRQLSRSAGLLPRLHHACWFVRN
jgi:hypothetical protein